MVDITSNTGLQIAGDTEQFPTGITEIDKALGGAQRGQLWVHASRHRSRHMIMMWAYQHALKGGRSLVISQDELPKYFRSGIERHHSYHPKFNGIPTSIDYVKRVHDHVLPDLLQNCGDVMYCNTLNLTDGGELKKFEVPLVFIDNFIQPGMTPNHCTRKTNALSQYAKELDIAIVATMDTYFGDMDAVVRTADVVTYSEGLNPVTFSNQKARDGRPFDSFSTDIIEWPITP